MSSLYRLLLRLLGINEDPSLRSYNYNQELYLQIRKLAEEEQRTPEEVTEQLLTKAFHQRSLEFDTWQRWNNLSKREQQVAALISLGHANGEIATRLGVTIDTVKSHVSSILYKFAITNRKELGMLLYGWKFDDILPPTSGGS